MIFLETNSYSCSSQERNHHHKPLITSKNSKKTFQILKNIRKFWFLRKHSFISMSHEKFKNFQLFENCTNRVGVNSPTTGFWSLGIHHLDPHDNHLSYSPRISISALLCGCLDSQDGRQGDARICIEIFAWKSTHAVFGGLKSVYDKPSEVMWHFSKQIHLLVHPRAYIITINRS